MGTKVLVFLIIVGVIGGLLIGVYIGTSYKPGVK